MEFFLQNNELTITPSELVKENSFIGKAPEEEILPVFEEIKSKLPNPVWESRDDAIQCYWKTWELAFDKLRTPKTGSGFVSNFIDSAFNDWLFMWDSAFILMFGKYANRVFNFQKTLDNFYSHQHRDGYICREICESDGKDRFTRFDPSATGPETMAWSEWEYFLNFNDIDRLSRVFPPLLAYHRWMAEHHTWPDGTYFTSGWGCGMDNIPRQMPGSSPHFSHGHMIWVDACLQALYDCKILIEMAKILNRNEFTEELTREHAHLCSVINDKLWDEETGFLYDLWKDGRLNGVRHVGAYWALISQCLSKDRADRLVSYLCDEKEFATPNMIPALSKSSSHFNPEGAYWCGGVWSPTTYMTLKGLDAYEMFDLSHQIGKIHLNAVTDVFKRYGTVFENYAPELNKEGNPEKGTPAKPDFVGWTGLSPISILFEYVFGIKPNAQKNKITWHINLIEKHGVENYPFGLNGTLTLLCDHRNKATEKPNIILKSNVPVTLEVYWGDAANRESMTIKSK